MSVGSFGLTPLKRRFLGYEVIMLAYVDYNVDNNEINNTNFFNLITPT